MEKVNFVYDDPSKLTSKDAGTLAIILNIFAIGTQYAHLESVGRTGKSDETTTSSTEWEGEIGAMFYRQATKLLPEVIHLASLESVQACLLFGFYALPIDASGLAYIYLNLAIKLAMQNGMHRRMPSRTFAPNVIEVRNRVWWTVYCTERSTVKTPVPALSVLTSLQEDRHFPRSPDVCSIVKYRHGVAF